MNALFAFGVPREALLLAMRGCAFITAWEDAPNVCPGCYAVDGERCASWCPDAAIERRAEEERELREIYDDCGDCPNSCTCDGDGCEASR